MSKVCIYVVSDATGATARQVVRAALFHHGGEGTEIKSYEQVRSVAQLEDIVAEAAPRSFVACTFGQHPELSSTLKKLGWKKRLRVVDLLELVSRYIGGNVTVTAPQSRLPANSEDNAPLHFSEAIHFTLAHDDGAGLSTLDAADLVILGASRTSKTPTSIFLSCRGLKVANVPVIKGLPLPEGLARLEVPKVGFRMNADRLRALRTERTSRLGARIPGYAEPESIREELRYCERMFASLPGLRVVDITSRSIEEVSDWITHEVL